MPTVSPCQPLLTNPHTHRRLQQMFGDVVLGIPHEAFEARLAALKQQRGVQYDVQLEAEDLRRLVAEYKQVGVGVCSGCVCIRLCVLAAAWRAV